MPMAPVSEKKESTVHVGHVTGGAIRKRKKRGSEAAGNPRSGRKRHAGSLPACQICLNPGSGFHYGADTCEPCKTFFRRNYSMQGNLDCKQGSACQPAPSKKFRCTACRLNRCIEVGMSLEGIKLGRYTDAKRARNRACDQTRPLLEQEITQPAPLPFSLMTPPDTPTDENSSEMQRVLSRTPSLLDQFDPRFLRSPSADKNALKVFDPSNTGYAEENTLVSMQTETVSTKFGLSEISPGMRDGTECCPFRQNSGTGSTGSKHSTFRLPRPGCTKVTSTTLAKPMMSVAVQSSSSGNVTKLGLLSQNSNWIDQFSPSSYCAPIELPMEPGLQFVVNGPSPQATQFDTLNLSDLDPLSSVGPQWTDNPALTPSLSIPPLVSGDIFSHLDAFIEHITHICTENDAHGSDFFQKIHKFFLDYLEKRQVKQRVFGSLQPLPLREYRQILLDTGLDVDGRLEQLTHRQLPIYEHSYDLYRKCVCAIPGFLDLPNEDQDVLIKRARIDYWMLCEFECFNVEMQLHALPNGFVMGVEDKALVFSRPFVRRMFATAGRFQQLGLTEHERNLLKCIYIFSRDTICTSPEGVETARRHHEFFRQVLQYYRQREGRLDTSAQLDARLEPLMRELDALEETDWHEFLALWKDFPMIQFPPVFKSFYFGSPTSDQSPLSSSL